MNRFKGLLWIALPLIGTLFAWRLYLVPSRAETAAFFMLVMLLPTMRFPKFGMYYLFTISLLIPMFRRMYYLVGDRPKLDYLMLISDGVMAGFVAALVLTWVLARERIRDPLSGFVLVYLFFLFIKIFFENIGGIQNGLYGFKFNGLYVLFFFAGSHIVKGAPGMLGLIKVGACALLFTALYGIKQITLGFFDFEQRWLDSITFTTLRIEGVVRPFSTYVSPAAMADGMCILFLVGVFYIGLRRGFNQIWGAILIAGSIFPLLIATVRTSWVGVTVAIFFYVFFLRIKHQWIRVAFLLAMVIGCFGFVTKSDSHADGQNAALSAQMGGSRSLTSVMIRNRTAALANPMQEYSIQKRMQIWQEIWYFALRYPLGRGQGTHGYAHSYYFQILGEIGFPGILAFLGILFLGFKRGFQILRLSPNHEEGELTRFFMSLIFMFAILNLTGTHLHTNPGDIWFWFSLGALSQIYRNNKPKIGLGPTRPEGNSTPILRINPLINRA